MIRNTRPPLSATGIPPALRAAIVALLVCAVRATAQMPTADLPAYGDLVYAEAAQVPGDSARLCRLDVFVRITHDYVVFHRAVEFPGDSSFAGVVELSYDVLDAENRMVATANKRKDVRVPNYAATESRDATVLLRQTFRLPAGEYRVRLQVSDGKSTRQRLIVLPARLRSLQPGALALGSILPLADSALRPGADYHVFAYGASVPFARPSLLALSCAVEKQTQWRYCITRNDAARAGRVVAAAPVEALAMLDNSTVHGPNDGTLECVFGPGATIGRVALFRLPFDTLEAGAYRLVLYASARVAGDSIATDSAVLECRVFWKEQPLSLRDPDFAVSVMRYILTESELSDFSKGSDAEILDKLSAYWRGKDPTPGTVRNELMEEYFRRADQAYFAYRTLASENGALTDRGKVYILFGAPENVQRTLKPGEAPEEVWRYPSLKRVFTFIDRERNGKYHLRS